MNKSNDAQLEGGWKGGSKVMESMGSKWKWNKNHCSEIQKLDTNWQWWVGHDYSEKKTIDCIIKPLSYIFNLSCHAGIFPNRIKTAKAIHFLKTGDKHSLTTYRPVSLLSQFSKVLEKLFVKNVDAFLDKNKLLSESQCGFQTNWSTALALIKIVEEITTAIECKRYTIGILMDLKKAFDTKDHNILIYKLHTHGMRGVV